jgi:hypothetical protein
VLSPVSSTMSSAFPTCGLGRLPASIPRFTTSRRRVLEAADIPLCSGLQVCSPPRSSLPLRVLPQGSRGFYVRAYRALLPPHAPDMLTVRIQAIDGTGTFTLSDSQPCRLLTSLRPHYKAFVTTTGCSVPALRVGTLALAVVAACDFSLHAPTDSERRDAVQVLTFRTKAWSSFALPTRRMPLGRSQDILRADPGGRVNPRF